MPQVQDAAHWVYDNLRDLNIISGLNNSVGFQNMGDDKHYLVHSGTPARSNWRGCFSAITLNGIDEGATGTFDNPVDGVSNAALFAVVDLDSIANLGGYRTVYSIHGTSLGDTVTLSLEVNYDGVNKHILGAIIRNGTQVFSHNISTTDTGYALIYALFQLPEVLSSASVLSGYSLLTGSGGGLTGTAIPGIDPFDFSVEGTGLGKNSDIPARDFPGLELELAFSVSGAITFGQIDTIVDILKGNTAYRPDATVLSTAMAAEGVTHFYGKRWGHVNADLIGDQDHFIQTEVVNVGLTMQNHPLTGLKVPQTSGQAIWGVVQANVYDDGTDVTMFAICRKRTGAIPSSADVMNCYDLSAFDTASIFRITATARTLHRTLDAGASDNFNLGSSGEFQVNERHTIALVADRGVGKEGYFDAHNTTKAIPGLTMTNKLGDFFIVSDGDEDVEFLAYGIAPINWDATKHATIVALVADDFKVQDGMLSSGLSLGIGLE